MKKCHGTFLETEVTIFNPETNLVDGNFYCKKCNKRIVPKGGDWALIPPKHWVDLVLDVHL